MQIFSKLILILIVTGLSSLNAQEGPSRTPALEFGQDKYLGRSPAVASVEYREPTQKMGRVFNCRSNLMVRTSPSANSSFIGRLPCSENTEVEILERTDNGWFKIEYEGQEAFVFGEYIELAETAEFVASELKKMLDFTPSVVGHIDYCQVMGMDKEKCDGDTARGISFEDLKNPEVRERFKHEVLTRRLESLRDISSVEEEDSYDGVEGCEVLLDVEGSDDSELTDCYDAIKDKITKGMDPRNLDRDQVFSNLYSELNEKEQEFAAMVMTAVGEAGILAPPAEEMVAVMKVLSNRAEYAQNRGQEDANALDAALQPWQFSIYNHNADDWKRVLNQNSSNRQTQNAIEAFRKYQDTSYKNPKDMKNVYHYHANFVSPNWAERSKLVNPVLNDKGLRQSGTRHIFYRDIAWSFRHNEWSGKR